MTDEQRQRIHTIIYSTDSREELAERIVQLEDQRNHWHVEQTHAYSNLEDACKRAKELESENAKLREQVLQLQLEWESEHDYADQMEAKEKRAVAENDKLRELVMHLYKYREMYYKTGIYPTDHGVTEHRMRELGIEVTENE